jgi:nitroreductase
MNVTEAVRQRISTRAFLDTPIPRDQLADLLETAQRSPSGGNLQPWKLIAVTGAAKDEIIGIAHRVLAADPMGVCPATGPSIPISTLSIRSITSAASASAR